MNRGLWFDRLIIWRRKETGEVQRYWTMDVHVITDRLEVEYVVADFGST